MQFRKFVGATMGEALAAVKQEMGEEAVIVSTRQVHNGLFKRKHIEVTCAIEEARAPQLFNQVAPVRPAQPPPSLAPSGSGYSVGPLAAPGPARRGDGPLPAPAATASATPPPGALSERSLERALEPIRRELRAVRLHISEQEGKGDGAENAEMREQFAGLRELIGHMWAERSWEAAPEPLLDLLAAADVAPLLARELVSEVKKGHADRGVLDSRAALQHDLTALRAQVATRLPMPSSPLAGPGPGPHRLALVGPPGVGKTLLLAKLIDQALSYGHKVALIGTDAWRIAAFEELSHFANLFEVPLVLAGDSKSLSRAMTRYQDCDVILLDTAGLTCGQEDQIGDLRALLAAQNVQVVLTLAATCRHAELRAALAAFAPLAPVALAFTKLDEAQVLGALVSACAHTGLPLHYLSGGQQPTSGLVITNPAELADRVVGMPLESDEFAWMTAHEAADGDGQRRGADARAQGGAYGR